MYLHLQGIGRFFQGFEDTGVHIRAQAQGRSPSQLKHVAVFRSWSLSKGDVDGDSRVWPFRMGTCKCP